MKWMGKVFTLLAAGVLSVGFAEAQFAPVNLKISVPFEFIVANRTLPAGDYWITRSAPHALVLRDAGQHFLATIFTVPVQASSIHSEPSVKFVTVGDSHLLLEVWTQGSRNGFEVPSRLPASVMARRKLAGTQIANDTQSSTHDRR